MPSLASDMSDESLTGRIAPIDTTGMFCARAGSTPSAMLMPNAALPCPTACSAPASVGSTIFRSMPASRYQPICWAAYTPRWCAFGVQLSTSVSDWAPEPDADASSSPPHAAASSAAADERTR